MTEEVNGIICNDKIITRKDTEELKEGEYEYKIPAQIIKIKQKKKKKN